MTDDELVQACLRRESAAERRFFERFSGLAMGICRRYGTSFSQAQDMHQEGFVRCYLSLKTYRGHGSLEGWVRRVFVSNCLDMLRRQRRWREQVYLEETTLDAPPAESNAFLLEAEAAPLVAAIAALPEGARVIFNLFAVEGYSHADIATLLAISEGASRAQLARARHLLRQRLAVPKPQPNTL